MIMIEGQEEFEVQEILGASGLAAQASSAGEHGLNSSYRRLLFVVRPQTTNNKQQTVMMN